MNNSNNSNQLFYLKSKTYLHYSIIYNNIKL